MQTKHNLIPTCLFAALLFHAASSEAQPVALNVQSSNTQVLVSWPSGLSLVQPQKRTNLFLGAWQDYGAATTASTLTEASTSGPVYYRLRLLAPSVTSPPQSQTNAVGSNVTFTVTATGTAPLAYQWLKTGTNLTGKTTASLGLTNLVAGDAANYRVVITNRAGAITSAVAVLTVTNPLARPAGICMGTFGSTVDSGDFAVLLRTNGLTYLVGYNAPQNEGVQSSGFSVALDGTFTTTTVQGGHVGGTFTASAVSGNFTNSTGGIGTFTGPRKADTGIHAVDAGYYVGNYTNLISSVTGTAYLVLAADGALVFYSVDVTGDGGGYGTINAANAMSAVTIPDGTAVVGTLAPATHVISGTYQSGAATVGNFSLTRTQTP